MRFYDKPHLNFKTQTKILKIVLKWLCHTYRLSRDLVWLQFIPVNPWRRRALVSVNRCWPISGSVLISWPSQMLSHPCNPLVMDEH